MCAGGKEGGGGGRPLVTRLGGWGGGGMVTREKDMGCFEEVMVDGILYEFIKYVSLWQFCAVYSTDPYSSVLPATPGSGP